MPKTSFTVHLDQESAEKIEQMKEENPDFSRNALIRLAIREYQVKSAEPADITGVRYDEMQDPGFEWFMIRDFKLRINALHKQINPDWKRKKSLPYHFPAEYNDVSNYSDSK